MAAASFYIDSRDYAHFAVAFNRLPAKIKAKAFNRAMRRVRDMTKTRIIRAASDWTDTPQKFIRPGTYATESNADITVRMRTQWINLVKLGAKQGSAGVRVKGRGLLEGAFIAGMKSGHMGVFIRLGKSSLPIHELYGANPAHAINRRPDFFRDQLIEIAEQHLVPLLLHEFERLIAVT